MLSKYAEMHRIISECRFDPWEIAVLRDGERCYLQVSDPDGVCHVTGKQQAWAGRKWFLSLHMTETELVKTALKAVLSAVEHETLEKFTYQGVAIFDPHISVPSLLALRKVTPLDAREPMALEAAE